MNSQSKNRNRLTIREDSPDGLRLAARFFIELGRPARFDNEATLTRWAGIMDALLSQSGLDYDEFRWFIIWATRLDELGNSFTAKNLRLARDPGASLERQFEMAYSIYSDETRHKLREMLVRRRTEEDKEGEFERIRAALVVPDDFRCPYCEYDKKGERKKWCRDCYEEMRGEGESVCVLGKDFGECPECLGSTPDGWEYCEDHGCQYCGKKPMPDSWVCETCSEKPEDMTE